MDRRGNRVCCNWCPKKGWMLGSTRIKNTAPSETTQAEPFAWQCKVLQCVSRKLDLARNPQWGGDAQMQFKGSKNEMKNDLFHSTWFTFLPNSNQHWSDGPQWSPILVTCMEQVKQWGSRLLPSRPSLPPKVHRDRLRQLMDQLVNQLQRLIN